MNFDNPKLKKYVHENKKLGLKGFREEDMDKVFDIMYEADKMKNKKYDSKRQRLLDFMESIDKYFAVRQKISAITCPECGIKKTCKLCLSDKYMKMSFEYLIQYLEEKKD